MNRALPILIGQLKGRCGFVCADHAFLWRILSTTMAIFALHHLAA